MDIYTVPYNNHQGGAATALQGASDPNYHEFYPVYSPNDTLLAFNRTDNARPPARTTSRTPSSSSSAEKAAPRSASRERSADVHDAQIARPHERVAALAPQSQASGTLNYYWMIFSSKRRPATGLNPQLYVAAIVTKIVNNVETLYADYPAVYVLAQDPSRTTTRPRGQLQRPGHSELSAQGRRTRPEIDAVTSTGVRFRLSDRKENLCTIVFFFPKAFTPGCTVETRRFRENYAELALLGARIVGVSTDDHDTQCLFAKEMRTPFPMIGDDGKSIARAYGVLWPILERAMRVTFVIDDARRIVSVIHHELNIVQHRDEVLRVLERMRSKRRDESTLVDAVPPVSIPGAPYDVLAEAGSGGMGTVYKAREHATGRVVALKILAKDACPVRFAREIDVLARLEHPNIVGYVGHGITEDGARTSRWSGSRARASARSFRTDRCRGGRGARRA